MDSMERGTTQAQAYLASNAALREAIGVEADAALDPQPLGMGEHNLNYRFADPASERRFVLRVNVTPQPFHANQVRYEFDALTALAPSGCAPEPLYVDDSPAAPGHGAMVIGFCDGDELDFDRLRPGDLRCAAQLMADVHAVAVAPDCPLHRPADPLSELFEECLERFRVYRSSPAEDPRITRWVDALTAAAATVADTPAAPGDCAHIVNTETLPSHFLIPADAASQAAQAPAGPAGTGRFVARPGAFVDWERPIIGDVAQDVAFFTAPTTTFWDSELLFPADAVEAFVEDYWRAVDGRFARGAFDERFRAFRMMAALRAVAWCCKALARYQADPALHRTDRAVAKLPTYLSDEFLEMLARECFGL